MINPKYEWLIIIYNFCWTAVQSTFCNDWCIRLEIKTTGNTTIPFQKTMANNNKNYRELQNVLNIYTRLRWSKIHDYITVNYNFARKTDYTNVPLSLREFSSKSKRIRLGTTGTLHFNCVKSVFETIIFLSCLQIPIGRRTLFIVYSLQVA